MVTRRYSRLVAGLCQPHTSCGSAHCGLILLHFRPYLRAIEPFLGLIWAVVISGGHCVYE